MDTKLKVNVCVQIGKRAAAAAEVFNTWWEKKETKRKNDILNGKITLLSTACLQDSLPAPKILFIIWIGRN